MAGDDVPRALVSELAARVATTVVVFGDGDVVAHGDARTVLNVGAENVPQLLVFNKLDALDAQHQPLQMQDEYEVDGTPVPRIFVSARAGLGLDRLRSALAQRAQQALGSTTPVEEDVRGLPREYPGLSD